MTLLSLAQCCACQIGAHVYIPQQDWQSVVERAKLLWVPQVRGAQGNKHALMNEQVLAVGHEADAQGAGARGAIAVAAERGRVRAEVALVPVESRACLQLRVGQAATGQQGTGHRSVVMVSVIVKAAEVRVSLGVSRSCFEVGEETEAEAVVCDAVLGVDEVGTEEEASVAAAAATMACSEFEEEDESSTAAAAVQAERAAAVSAVKAAVVSAEAFESLYSNEASILRVPGRILHLFQVHGVFRGAWCAKTLLTELAVPALPYGSTVPRMCSASCDKLQDPLRPPHTLCHPTRTSHGR
jgi:hypothetical protein